MKKILFSIIIALTFCQLDAQSVVSNNNRDIDLSGLYKINTIYNAPSAQSSANYYQTTPCHKQVVGRNLLIAGGCLMGAGLITYPLSFTMIDGPRAVGGLFSVGGLVLMGSSVPLFVAGSILYVQGKNECVSLSANGLTVKF